MYTLAPVALSQEYRSLASSTSPLSSVMIGPSLSAGLCPKWSVLTRVMVSPLSSKPITLSLIVTFFFLDFLMEKHVFRSDISADFGVQVIHSSFKPIEESLFLVIESDRKLRKSGFTGNHILIYSRSQTAIIIIHFCFGLRSFHSIFVLFLRHFCEI